MALQAPGTPRDTRRAIQRSEILSRLNQALPPSGPILKSLARFDPFPEIDAPTPRVPRPTARITRDPDVRRASRSVVKVLGTACGLRVQGSGWVARAGVVVTNAHVVAGEDDSTVQVGGVGPLYPTQAIWFDARNDLAILRAPGIGGVPAAAAEHKRGTRHVGGDRAASRKTGRSRSSRAGWATPPRC